MECMIGTGWRNKRHLDDSCFSYVQQPPHGHIPKGAFRRAVIDARLVAARRFFRCVGSIVVLVPRGPYAHDVLTFRLAQDSDARIIQCAAHVLVVPPGKHLPVGVSAARQRL